MSANGTAEPGGNETGSTTCAFCAGVRDSRTVLASFSGSDAPLSCMVAPEDEQGLDDGVQPSSRMSERSIAATLTISLNAMLRLPAEASRLEPPVT